MKKHKVFLSVTLVISMIFLSTIGEGVFAGENSAPIVNDLSDDGGEYGIDGSLDTVASDSEMESYGDDRESSKKNGSVSENVISSEKTEVVSGNANEATESDESAGGTSWDTAIDINLNQSYSDSVANYNDNNYYHFAVDKPGEISITFDHEYEDSGDNFWTARIYNSNERDGDKNLSQWGFKGNAMEAVTTDSLGIPAGGFYLLIGRDHYSSKNYNFKVNYTQSDNWEKEFNNTFITANKIPVNTEMNGALQFYNEEDYYCFELADPGRIRISFDHEPFNDGGRFWVMNLYKYEEPEESFLDEGFIGNAVNTAYTPFFGLGEGKYILKIHRDHYSSLNYKFKIDYLKSSNWEKENNRNFLTATKIGTNIEYSGSLQQYYDEDYYSFTINENDNISFSFKHDLLNDGNSFWVLHLFNYNDMNKELGTFWFIGNEPNTVTTSASYLEAGTYIVRINRNSYSNATYTFKVNSEKNKNNVTGVSVAPKTISLSINETAQLTATVVPSDATNKAVTWKSSDAKVAAVDSNGKVTATGEGSANIVVTTDEGGFTATAKITVVKGKSEEPDKGKSEKPDKGDDNSDPDAELVPNDDGTYSYTLLLGEKYTVNISGIEKTSLKAENAKIVSVADKKKGTVQGKKVGSADVICTVNGSQGVIHFKVEYPAVNASNNYVLAGDKLPFYIKGTKISNIKWSVNNSNASITEDGVLTGVKAGSTQVTATIHKRKYRVKINIEAPRFAKSSYEVKAGSIAKIKLGGTKQTSKVAYSIGDEDIATFIPDGRIAALSPGTTTLTATLGERSFTTQIIVN